MDNQQKLIISNEKEAFDAILKAIKNEINTDVKVVFESWPKLTIELEGQGYEAAITPSIMKSLINFQEGLNRSYLKVVHDETNLNFLKDDDKRELEFKAKVENGCTLIDIDLSEFAQKISGELLNKMDGQQIVITILGLGVLWTATSVAKTYFTSSSKDKETSEKTKQAIAFSQEETKRQAILADALTAQPRLVYVKEEASSATLGLLKGVSDAESIEINGVKFAKNEANLISQTKRSESNDMQINGNYKILSVDTSHTEEVKIKVHFIDDGREFTAKFKDNTLDGTQIALLQRAEWEKPKKKIYLSVNATELRGNITTATIVSVMEQP